MSHSALGKTSTSRDSSLRKSAVRVPPISLRPAFRRVCSHQPTARLTGCGNSFENGGTNTTLSDCDSPCTGDATELCGAGSECALQASPY